MPEKGTFQGPVSGRILAAGSAGRVETVRFDDAGFGHFPGFRALSFYLKACFVKSEIQHIRKRSFL